MPWPSAEDLFKVLDGKELAYMPPEVNGWMNAMYMLNEPDEDFEVKGGGAQVDKQDGPQWLPSTALVALRLLRKQDPVSLWEDRPIPFAALANFVRNWAHKFQPHIEANHENGSRAMHRRFVRHSRHWVSKAFGRFDRQRGIVVLDPDYNRHRCAHYCQELLKDLHKQWMSSCVVLCYDLSPELEPDVRKFHEEAQQLDRTMDLWTIELTVTNKNWKEGDDEEERFRGCGVLINKPPFTTADRVKAAMTVIIQELQEMPEAEDWPMSVRVEKLEHDPGANFVSDREFWQRHKYDVTPRELVPPPR